MEGYIVSEQFRLSNVAARALCYRTQEERAAFDAGLMAGADGKEEKRCPHQLWCRGDRLTEAWTSGYSTARQALTGRS